MWCLQRTDTTVGCVAEQPARGATNIMANDYINARLPFTQSLVTIVPLLFETVFSHCVEAVDGC